MATYPSALKTFTNPTTTDTLNSPSHAQQHSDANDEIVAVQTELGLLPKGGYASVKARLDATALKGANSDITSLTGLTTALSTSQGGTGTSATAFCNLATNVSGTLPVANGGTGSTASNVANGVVIMTSAGKLPAVDGSLLTNVAASTTTALGSTYTSGTEYTNSSTRKIMVIIYAQEGYYGGWYNCNVVGYTGSSSATTAVAGARSIQGDSTRGSAGGYWQHTITFIVPPSWKWKYVNTDSYWGGSNLATISRIETWEI